MASLLRRTVVLSFSRFASQAIVLVSPLLLVRILTVGEYGAYREFLLYVGLIGPVASFAVARSLQYLLPKHPNQERVWITQTSLFGLALTSVAIIGIFVAGDLIRANTSFDFVTVLQLYIFFCVNLDFIEFYCLGKKRTDLVLYYSTVRLLARMTVVVTVAYLTEDARSIAYSLMALEAIRCILVFCYAIFRRWFTFRLTRRSLYLQMTYFLPSGAGGVIETLNSNVGMLFISVVIGAEALAFYVIGTFATQIVEIIRGAIADVIFPDIVELRTAEPRDALPLWQRATVWYSIMLFPVAILFSYYADAIVTILFTQEYAEAIPIFSAYALLMFNSCFDFHLPLRVQNKNRYFLAGSVIALVTNSSLLYPMHLLFGLLGPAIAFMLSRLVMTIYLASCVLRIYKVSVRDLVLWRDVSKVFVASIICAPILVAGKYFVEHLFVRSILFGLLYLAAYVFVLRILSVSEAYAMLRALSGSRWGSGR